MIQPSSTSPLLPYLTNLIIPTKQVLCVYLFASITCNLHQSVTGSLLLLHWPFSQPLSFFSSSLPFFSFFLFLSSTTSSFLLKNKEITNLLKLTTVTLKSTANPPIACSLTLSQSCCTSQSSDRSPRKNVVPRSCPAPNRSD